MKNWVGGGGLLQKDAFTVQQKFSIGGFLSIFHRIIEYKKIKKTNWIKKNTS